MTPGIAVTTNSGQLTATRQLADELQLPFIPDYDDPRIHEYNHVLILTNDYLAIQATAAKKFTPFYIDFTSGKMRYRSDHAGLKRELLARALNVKPKDHPCIIDATAGLGRDSFILATLGFTVTALERSPVIFALLRDALRRAAHDPATTEIASRLKLIHADAENWLTQYSKTIKPDIIYLDPMFPERDKTASVKKEMVILQNLLANDTDSESLLQTAIACSTRRVVVKRSRLAPALSGLAPSYTLAGKSSRFDIYLV